MSNARDNTLEFQCPKCARRLKAGSQAAGKRLKCPGCGQAVKVPGGAANVAADDDWLQMDAPSPPPSTPKPTDPRPNVPEPISSEQSASNPPLRPTTAAASRPEAVAPAADREPTTAPTVTNAIAQPKRAGSIFDDDLPELAELEAPRPRADLNVLLGTEALDALMSPPAAPNLPKGHSPTAKSSKEFSRKGESASAGAAPRTAQPRTAQANIAPPSTAQTKETKKKAVIVDPAQQQYRVPCPSCGTPQYVTVAMKGRNVRCPDCFLDFKIPAPPPNWKPSDKPAHTNWGTGLAEQPAGEAERDAARSRSQADDYLRRAELELADDDIDTMYAGDFDTRSFMERTLGFCFDSAALFQVVLYSTLFAILFGVAQWGAQRIAAGDKSIMLMVGIAVPLMFLMTAFPMFAAAMTMLESIANGQRRVKEWPGFSFFDHIGELLLFTVALAAAAVPGFLLGSLIGRSGGMPWMVVLGTMLSTFLTFPIIMLSMLDNESMFNPLSPDVLKSLSNSVESWGVYYFKNFVAYSIVFISWCVLFGGNPLLTGIAGAMLPWLIFFTCQQLGVLAMDISDHLSLYASDDVKAKPEEVEKESL